MTVRQPSKAGAWYSADADALATEIDSFVSAAAVTPTGPLVAAVVPHAGLAFSGPTAARAYAWLRATNSDVDTFVVFGAVHTTRLDRPAIWAAGSWDTPLGEIRVDEELAAKLVDAGIGSDDETPHYEDNAIELQTPFIRHLFPEARIVAVATPAAAVAVEAGAGVFEVASRLGRNIVAVGSTDLTHYGGSFGFMPAGEGAAALEWSKANDRRLLALMETMQAEEIIPVAARERSACGAGAVAAALSFAQSAGSEEGLVLEHTTSHDVTPEGTARHFVGYAAVVYPVPQSR